MSSAAVGDVENEEQQLEVVSSRSSCPPTSLSNTWQDTDADSALGGSDATGSSTESIASKYRGRFEK